jgi:hypothetical protein
MPGATSSRDGERQVDAVQAQIGFSSLDGQIAKHLLLTGRHHQKAARRR